MLKRLSTFACGGRLFSVRGLLLLVALAGLTSPVAAEGTRTLHPSGATGNRGVMDSSDGTFFANVARGRQFLYVYAQAGEYILLGSRNRSNGGDVFVYDPQAFGMPGDETIPGASDFACSSQAGGTIASRAEELAGPNSADGSATVVDGFDPCWYVAPETGIYGVRFTGASSGGQTNTASIATPPILEGSLVSAWDVTVRSAANSLIDIDGRLFTYAWTVYLQSNGRTLENELYYVSTDGYRYRQIFRGLDPNRAAFYANAAGFIDTNGGPLYRDMRGSNAAVTTGPSITAGISAQRPQYPIFFSDISPAGPNGAEVNRVLTALAIPQVPSAPQLSDPSFVGNIGGNTSTVSAGGVFTFTTLNTLSYEIVISRDGVDFDPASVLNRVLTGAALTGTHSVLWNGLDNNGNPFPAGDYEFRIVGRNGEIHFPMIDVEGNAGGGPTLTKLNGSQDSTVYYDDRGYTAANGTLIGMLNGHLCGATSAIVQPVPTHSLVGVDSADNDLSGSGNYYRSWSGSNDSNADCTNSATQYFATAKGLDLWALERSPVFQEPIEIVEPSDGVDVGTMVSVTSTVLPGETAYGSFAFSNAGDTTATGVTYNVSLGNPANPATCPSAVNFTLIPSGVIATYNAAPVCTITFSGMPATLAPGQSLNFNFNYVVAVSNPGAIPIETIIAAGNETPGAPAPNTASAQTVVARPVITVMKNSSPAPGTQVDVGDEITYTLSATIANAPLTSALTLTDTLGTGLTFGTVTSSHPGFTCVGSLACTLPSGTTVGTYTVTYTATVNNLAVGSVANNVVPSGGGGNPPTCTACSVEHPLVPPPSYAFCPAAGDAAQVFNLVNGVNIYGYTPPAATPDTLLPLLPATMSGNLNALMLDPVNNRLLMIQRPTTGTQSTLWAYDAANGGWYIAAGPFTSPDFPRGGFNEAGTGYLLSGGANPEVWSVVAQPLPSFAYTVTQLGTMNYDVAPTDTGSGDIAFDGDGTAWLAVGQDLWHLDLGTLVATRQTRPLLGGSPSTINWAGIAFASNGTLILANNSSPSAYYQYDPGTGVITHLVDTTANSARDLTSCAFPTLPVPELSVVKTLDQVNGGPPAASVFPGDVLRYAITISNTGGAAATLYPGDILETLPANTTVVIAGNDFTCAGSNCPNTNVVNIAAGSSVTLHFVVQLDTPLPTTQISNAVVIPDEVDCSVAPNDCTEVTPVGPRVAMSKTLQSGGPVAQPGGSLVYAITLTNLTAVPANVAAGSIGETVPLNTTHAGADNFSCAASTAGSACANSAAVLVPASGSTVLTFAVTVANPIPSGVLSIQNTATPPPGVSCPTCTVTTPTAPSVTLVKALTGETGSQTGVAEPGETLTYTITLANGGGTAFANYDFVENVPTGATLNSLTGAGVSACATPVVGAGTCNVTVASVPANGTTTVTVVFTVANPVPAGTTSITNLVNGGDTTCTTPNVCSVTTPTVPSVTLVKALTGESGTQTGVAEPGETLTYTITLSNGGGTAFSNYDFVENVPVGASLTSVAGAGVTTAACVLPVTGAGTCNVTVASVPANGSTTVTVVFTVADPIPAGTTSILNLVNGGDTTCTAPNVCSVTTPTAPSVTLVKALTAESGSQTGIAEPGETLTYTITLTNGGGTAFANYDFVETVPAGATLTSVTGTGVTTSACALPVTGAGTCNVTVASVPADGSTTVTIVFAVADPIPAGTTSIVNLVSGGDTSCTAPNVCSVTTPTAPRVTLVKALTAESGSQAGVAEPGETLTYTITLSNGGGTAFTNYDFVENVPTAATLASVTGAGVTACATPVTGAGTCNVTVATIPANGSTTVTVVFTVADPIPGGTTSITNLVSGGDTTCPQPGNTCTVTTPTAGRVSIAKSVVDASGNGIAEPGETLTWTITLTNSGGSIVTGFGVTDPLDPNTSFISASHGGTHAAGTVTWTSLTVPAQVGPTPGTLALTVTTTVDAPIPEGVRIIGNLAHETGGTPPDCSVTPAPANCASIPTAANVSVAKALSAESITADGIAEPGEQLTYTITLRNHGGTMATNVIVNETVPLHTTFVSGTPGWDCVAGSAAGTACGSMINVPAADAGGTPGVATLTFTVAVVDPLPIGVQQIANAVAINDGTPPDCLANPTHVQCVVTPTINLGFVKSVESVTATGPGTYWIAYRIDLANTGGSPVSYTLIDTPDFTSMGVTITGNGIAATTSGTLNPALPGGAFTVANGTGVQISANSVTLAVGAMHSYTVRIPIAVSPGSLANATCTGAPGNGLYNRASVTGSFARDSSACAPVSGEQALIRLVKSVRLGVDANGDHYGNVGDALHYTFTISNPGTVSLSAIDLIDPRVTNLQCDATTAYGESMRVLRGDELFIGVFEDLLGGSLVPGDSIMCSATYAITAQDVLNRRVVNTATTHGAGSDGQVVSSTSTAIYTNIR